MPQIKDVRIREMLNKKLMEKVITTNNIAKNFSSSKISMNGSRHRKKTKKMTVDQSTIDEITELKKIIDLPPIEFQKVIDGFEYETTETKQ